MLGGKGAKRAYISGFLTAGTEGHRFTNATQTRHKRDWIGLVALLDDLRNVTREIRGTRYEECS